LILHGLLESAKDRVEIAHSAWRESRVTFIIKQALAKLITQCVARIAPVMRWPHNAEPHLGLQAVNLIDVAYFKLMSLMLKPIDEVNKALKQCRACQRFFGAMGIANIAPIVIGAPWGVARPDLPRVPVVVMNHGPRATVGIGKMAKVELPGGTLNEGQKTGE
jgi:hypothetical protein